MPKRKKYRVLYYLGVDGVMHQGSRRELVKESEDDE